MEGFLFCIPPFPPRKCQFIFIHYLKTPPPLPLGISNDLPWGGYGFFLEVHNECTCIKLTVVERMKDEEIVTVIKDGD